MLILVQHDVTLPQDGYRSGTITESTDILPSKKTIYSLRTTVLAFGLAVCWGLIHYFILGKKHKKPQPGRRDYCELVIFADENGGAEDGGPEAALVADGGLRDVHGAHDLVGDAIDLFFLVEGQVRIKFHVQRRRKHFSGEFFCIFAGDFFGFTEGVMFGQITIHGFVAGQRQANAGSDEPVRFLGGIFADDRERDLAGPDVLQSFAAGNQFAVGREDGGDADDVACRNPCVPQGELEARKPFAMFTDAVGEEDYLSNERHCAGLPCLREWCECEKSSAGEK